MSLHSLAATPAPGHTDRLKPAAATKAPAVPQKATVQALDVDLDEGVTVLVWIGCPKGLNDKRIRQHYKSLPPSAITNVHFAKNKFTKQLTGSVFVTFASNRLAKQALAVGQPSINRETITVRPRSENAVQRPNEHKMFLGQCPDPDTAAVKAHYQRLGEDAIDRVYWCNRDDGAFRGFGFVYFRSAELLQQAGAIDPPTINDRVTVVDIQSGFNNGRANRIILTGCPSTIEESDIKSHYARALGDAALTSVTWGTMADGHVRAFIQFSTAELAKQAAELEPPTVDGEKLRVHLRDKSAAATAAQTGPDGEPLGPAGPQKEYKMFIRNCPQWIEDKHILDHYTPLIGEGVIQKVEWATSRLDGSFRGFGFAFFNSLEDLTEAAKHPPPIVDSRQLAVNVSQRSV